MSGAERHLAFLHPVDFSALEKGQVLSTEFLIERLKVLPTQRAWSLATMKLVEEIRRKRPELVACQDRNTIKILRDNEVANYQLRRAASACSTLATAEELGTRVDLHALTDDEKRAQESANRITFALNEHAQSIVKKNSNTLASIRAMALSDGEEE